MDTVEWVFAVSIFVSQLLLVLGATGVLTAVAAIFVLKVVDLVIDRARERRRTQPSQDGLDGFTDPEEEWRRRHEAAVRRSEHHRPVWPNEAGAPE